MKIKQKIKQLAIMKEMLQDMRQERIEASAMYSDTSEFIQQLDADISLAALVIRDCQKEIGQQQDKR